MNTCPCCGNSLLRHIHHGSLYWFCTSCWQEMPNFEAIGIENARTRLTKSNLSGRLTSGKLTAIGAA